MSAATTAAENTSICNRQMQPKNQPKNQPSKKRKVDVGQVLKDACQKYHPTHVAQLHAEVSRFTKLVQQKDGFNEKDVHAFGDVDEPAKRLLASMAMVTEGIPYTVDGTVKLFDSAQHLYEFLQHGVPDQVGMWARGGIMSCYTHVFGEEKGNQMKESSWKDFIGIIPFMLVQPHNQTLRVSLGLELRSDVASGSGSGCLSLQQKPLNSHHYQLWRPVLIAKFSMPRYRNILMETGDSYLLDKEDIKKVKGESQTGCVMYPKPKKSASEDERKVYDDARKNKCRQQGSLVGKNRMGRFLMAIRSELRMMHIVRQEGSASTSGSSNTSGGSKKRKAGE